MRDLQNFSSWAERQRRLIHAFKQIQEEDRSTEELEQELEEVRRKELNLRENLPDSAKDAGPRE